MHPLRSALRSLHIIPKSVERVTQFMDQRLEELRYPRKSRAWLYGALLSIIMMLCLAAMIKFSLIFAWIIACVLLVPAGFLALGLGEEWQRASRKYAEWTEEQFWPYWRMAHGSSRPVPWHIQMLAEEVQTHLPTCQLTVCHLYEDAFLCARHKGVLGAADEFYVIEHWGSQDFR